MSRTPRRFLAALACTALGVSLGLALLPSGAHAVDKAVDRSVDQADDGLVRQIGTYASLTAPDYTGLAPIDAGIAGRTLGLGTFNDLDGEFVLVGGEGYSISTDGVPHRVDPMRTTPFVEAIRFAPQASGPVPPGTTCAQLAARVDELAGTTKGMIAVRVRGTFTDLVARSVPAQARPYRPLAQVVAEQTVFPLGQRRAVLVGFRTGPDLAGTGAPGLHLHGVTADRTAGGHVLSCVAGPDVQLTIQRAQGVAIRGAAGQ